MSSKRGCSHEHSRFLRRTTESLGRRNGSSAIPATASTASSARSSATARSTSSSRGTRKWRRSWPSPTPNSQASSASASRPAARARRTSSPACTTPSSTTCRCSRSAARPKTTVRGGSYQQELNLDRVFADVAEYVQEVSTPGAAAARDRPRDPARHRAARPVGGRSSQRMCRSKRSKRRSARTASRAPAPAIRGRCSFPPKPTCAKPRTCSTPARRSRS